LASEASATRRHGGHRPDLTTEPVGSTLIAFALPVLGSNMLQALNGSINTAWVSHILGEAALTAATNAGQIFFLLISVVFGLSITANIMVGQAFGARDEALARKVVGSCATFFIVASVTQAAVGVWLTPAIVDGMGTPLDARADAIIYLRVIFMAMPSMYFFNFVMVAQRGLGDSRTPFCFAVMQVGLDILLNPLLIIGVGPFPRLGIAGSAASTLISQSLTLAVMLAHLYQTRSILAIRRSHWRLLIPDLGIMRTLVFKGVPMGFQMIVVNLAGLTMMRLINGFGTMSAAAYGAAMQLWSYVQMPAIAIGCAVSAMAAQNVGAGRMDRVDRIAWVGALYSLLSTLGLILLAVVADRFVLLAFLPASSLALPIAEHINLVVIWAFAAIGVYEVYSGVVRATGAVWPPLFILIITVGFVRVPFAYALQPYWGADAVWISFPVGSLVTVILAIAYYRWGGWRQTRLLNVVPHREVADAGSSPPSALEDPNAQAQAEGRLACLKRSEDAAE
jgi:putative MATE family efflux protein